MKGYHVAQARPGDKVTTKPDVKNKKTKKKTEKTSAQNGRGL